MREIINGFLEIVLPSKCKICGQSSADALCPPCYSALPRLPRLQPGGHATFGDLNDSFLQAGRSFSFDEAHSGGPYSGTLKEAIHLLKYKNGKRLAPHLAELISECASAVLPTLDAITYVPLSPYREASRGYNQSRLIAKELARAFDKPLYTGLVKTRLVTEQNKLGLSERAQNIKGAFQARIPISGHIGLIDDVITTGSTANECALELKKAGASRICVLTVAKTPLETR